MNDFKPSRIEASRRPVVHDCGFLRENKTNHIQSYSEHGKKYFVVKCNYGATVMSSISKHE